MPKLYPLILLSSIIAITNLIPFSSIILFICLYELTPSLISKVLLPLYLEFKLSNCFSIFILLKEQRMPIKYTGNATLYSFIL